MLIFFVVLISCFPQQDTVQFNERFVSPPFDTTADYYSDDYRKFSKEGFTIRRKKKEHRSASYQLNFNPKNKLAIKKILI